MEERVGVVREDTTGVRTTEPPHPNPLLHADVEEKASGLLRSERSEPFPLPPARAMRRETW